ncbi:TadE-like protein [Micromonospora viridifaciens]|uniref:TadE-like protein n=1 Tax=Micromonospora viridifaciens TaxID=1881 RepID=A0A1C4U595_MICVI|nr:TadE family protein [Micromonospora viridifaciens]SCE66777.1 TadE-like protein [Micromonospora viridifaciens]
MPRPARTHRSRPASAERPTGRRSPGRITVVRGRLVEGGAERGANPVELAVVMPAILVLLFASIQLGVWFVARSTALNAAQTGVNAERALQAPPGAGRDRATTFLRAAGDWLVDWQSPGPTCTRTATEATCTVSGRSLSVIPGVHFPVRQTAHGPVERWTTG